MKYKPNSQKAPLSEENGAYQNLDKVTKPFIHLAKWTENYTAVFK